MSAVLLNPPTIDDDNNANDHEFEDDDRVYTFDELDDEAKEKARDWYRGCGDGWGSDEINDSFQSRFEEIGIDGKLHFSIEFVQGDYVSFAGSLDIKKFLDTATAEAIAEEQERTDRTWCPNTDSSFTEVRRLLRTLPKAIRDDLSIRFTEGRGYHGMYVEFDDPPWVDTDEFTDRELAVWRNIDTVYGELQKALEEMTSTLCGWLLRQGHDEVMSQRSDEVVDEAMREGDYEFDREGERI